MCPAKEIMKKVYSIHQLFLRTTPANFLKLYTYHHLYCTHFKVGTLAHLASSAHIISETRPHGGSKKTVT